MPQAIHRATQLRFIWAGDIIPRDSGDLTQFQYLNGQTSDVSTTRITHLTASQTTFEQSFKGARTHHVDGGAHPAEATLHLFFRQAMPCAAGSGRTRLSSRMLTGKCNLADVTTGSVPTGCQSSTDTNLCRLTSGGSHHGSPRANRASDTMHYVYQDPNWPGPPVERHAPRVVSGQTSSKHSPMTE